MDFAIRISDEEKVFAEDFLDIKRSPYGFRCPYPECEIELTLKSYDSEKNLKSPYFARSFNDKPHTKECGTNHKKKTGKTHGIDNSIPLDYKNKLLFVDEVLTPGPHKGISPSKNKGPNKFAHGSFHNRTARHISAIVRWYLQNPNQGDSELEVPECTYGQYKSVFQKIYASPEKKYKGTHIFFAPMFFQNPLIEDENKIIFNLYQSNDAEPIKLTLDTKNWKDSQKQLTKNWVHDALQECRVAYKKRGNKNKALPYVFFLGRADKDSRRSFYCNKHAAFYARTVENLNLVTSNSGIYTPHPPREQVTGSQTLPQPVVRQQLTPVTETEKKEAPISLKGLDTPKQSMNQKDNQPVKQAVKNDIKRESKTNRKKRPFREKIKSLFSWFFE